MVPAEPLADHDFPEFACGNAELDDWLRRHARMATGQGTRTYVLVDEDGRVVGYFALAPHLLARDRRLVMKLSTAAKALGAPWP